MHKIYHNTPNRTDPPISNKIGQTGHRPGKYHRYMNKGVHSVLKFIYESLSGTVSIVLGDDYGYSLYNKIPYDWVVIG